MCITKKSWVSGAEMLHWIMYHRGNALTELYTSCISRLVKRLSRNRYVAYSAGNVGQIVRGPRLLAEDRQGLNLIEYWLHQKPDKIFKYFHQVTMMWPTARKTVVLALHWPSNYTPCRWHVKESMLQLHMNLNLGCT